MACFLWLFSLKKNMQSDQATIGFGRLLKSMALNLYRDANLNNMAQA